MMMNTKFYKLTCLEKALVELKSRLAYKDTMRISLTPTQTAVLLLAARRGAADIYRDNSLLDEIKLEIP